MQLKKTTLPELIKEIEKIPLKEKQQITSLTLKSTVAV
jgi:hypothetical protein